jgi:hypothetical protein
MKRKLPLILMFALLFAVPSFAGGKKHPERAMIEKMEAVPCGAKERGLTGLGSIFASVGATAVNSSEKLCPQYMLRSDDMEYHVRPLDKHPRILPVGQEGEFKINKDVMLMRIPDGDHKKRRYQVVAMTPIDHSGTGGAEGASYKHGSPNAGFSEKALADKTRAEKSDVKPSQPTPPPQ